MIGRRRRTGELSGSVRGRRRSVRNTVPRSLIALIISVYVYVSQILENGVSVLNDSRRCGRPYVLRDASNPFQTLTLSDRASNLEDIERRLKLDILDEARRYGGLLLFHDEVSTPREVWEDVSDEGWMVKYFRIPIAPDRPIEVTQVSLDAKGRADRVGQLS
jgi:hypothetical protein